MLRHLHVLQTDIEKSNAENSFVFTTLITFVLIFFSLETFYEHRGTSKVSVYQQENTIDEIKEYEESSSMQEQNHKKHSPGPEHFGS